MTENRIIELLQSNAIEFGDHELTPGMIREMVGDARVVLIGEATHGTHDFYKVRAEITKWLIENAGFNAVAIEGDWPDAYRVNRYVRGAGGELEAVDALEGFERFPTWMWRNTDVLDFIGWLRDYNEQQSSEQLHAGFYGLDLYSLFTSAEAVIHYLDKVDPEEAQSARTRYQCLASFGTDAQSYARAMAYELSQSCENDVVHQLIEIQRRRAHYLSLDGHAAEEEQFAAEQNATAVKNSERYYRTMLRGNVNSWNLRDSHMMATLKELMTHLERHGEPAKVIVWAHNSHVGDARATDMGQRGQLNIGQLARDHFGKDAVLIGFSTHQGTVIAASNWDMPAMRMHLQPAQPDSYEALFHVVGHSSYLLPMKDDVAGALAPKRLQRAVGVVYRPDTELQSHYYKASLPQQFDAVIHIDHTRSLEPLERIPEHGLENEPPETYPSGL
jgi:erythromycin esterase-like protein